VGGALTPVAGLVGLVYAVGGVRPFAEAVRVVTGPETPPSDAYPLQRLETGDDI
jgi:hypothetical protein